MSLGIYSSNFSEIFSKLLAKSKVSCYQIGQYADIDEAYLSRLKSGEKQNPSAKAILKISIGLAHFGKNIKLADIEGLLNSIGRSIYTKQC